LIKVEAGVLQEEPCALALGDEPPGQRPGLIERVDEALALDHFQHLARHMPPAGHVEVEPMTDSRGNVAWRPPAGEQLGFGDGLSHPVGSGVD
jgi:hypothetical protein